MNCRYAERLLSEQQSGPLPEHKARGARAHLAACPACRMYQQALRGVLGDVRASLPPSPPGSLLARRAVARWTVERQARGGVRRPPRPRAAGRRGVAGRLRASPPGEDRGAPGRRRASGGASPSPRSRQHLASVPPRLGREPAESAAPRPVFMLPLPEPARDPQTAQCHRAQHRPAGPGGGRTDVHQRGSRCLSGPVGTQAGGRGGRFGGAPAREARR